MYNLNAGTTSKINVKVLLTCGNDYIMHFEMETSVGGGVKHIMPFL